ncbi:MAG: hypothetical protein AB8B65_08985 [Kordia sp.]|uniref:hypothetical protein n=1 Tax=Kordia sp. TaxID=1965332 RepID=UPI00385A0145
MKKNLDNQINAIGEYVYNARFTKHSVGSFFNSSRNNKIENLRIAKNVGLLIPDTWILNHKNDLIKIVKKHRVICKSTNSDLTVKDGNFRYGNFGPIEVNEKLLESISERFTLSLFQKYIDKLFEIRIFYWAGRMWSMAIFSQNDTQTTLDYRAHNGKKPTRMIPFKLPKTIETMIIEFMNKGGFMTGSIDMIYSKEKEYYFLEINPVGQFNFLSFNCNFNIEKEIANYFKDIIN